MNLEHLMNVISIFRNYVFNLLLEVCFCTCRNKYLEENQLDYALKKDNYVNMGLTNCWKRVRGIRFYLYARNDITH